MPKIPHVYQDKKSGLWYFVASLGYDEHGKRIQYWGLKPNQKQKRDMNPI